MKTLEIVVDEMPISCHECPFVGRKYMPTHDYCKATGTEFNVDFGGRLQNCPIVAWQSAETAPRDGMPFIAIWWDGRIDTLKYNNEMTAFCNDFGDVYVEDDFVSWRPMPKTPEARA